MKCPFCQQELEQITTSNPLGLGRIEMAVCKKCMDKGVLHIMPIWDWQALIRTRKENEDKQAVLNCAVDMLKTLNQKYALIMGKDIIKETVRLLEQNKGGDNE